MKKYFLQLTIIILVVMTALFIWVMYLNKRTIPVRHEKTVVGAIFNSSVSDGGWNEVQYEGLVGLTKEMGIVFTYRENVTDDLDEFRQVVADLVDKDKAEIVFVTSYDYGPALLEVAQSYPQVKFFHVAGVDQANNVATYFGRMYQARYLTGIVAGLTTQTNQIGYVAAYPIPEVIRGINAFTLGVRSVCPEAEVHVVWSYCWNDEAREMAVTENLLSAWPIDVLAQHQNTVYPMRAAQQHGGVDVIGYNIDHQSDFPDIFLTAPVWNWESFYRQRLQSCFEGRFEGRHYFESMNEGLVDIAPLHAKVPPEANDKIQQVKDRLQTGTWDIFYGPIYDQEGNLRVRAGENLSDEYILRDFNWFVQGVEGSI